MELYVLKLEDVIATIERVVKSKRLLRELMAEAGHNLGDDQYIKRAEFGLTKAGQPVISVLFGTDGEMDWTIADLHGSFKDEKPSIAQVKYIEQGQWASAGYAFYKRRIGEPA